MLLWIANRVFSVQIFHETCHRAANDFQAWRA
jgi:hypothetical protein